MTDSDITPDDGDYDTSSVVLNNIAETVQDYNRTFYVLGVDPTDPDTECTFCGRTNTPYLGLEADRRATDTNDPTDEDGHHPFLGVSALCPQHRHLHADERAWFAGEIAYTIPIDY